MTFPVVRVLGASPRPGQFVFNAPRPLPGAEQWIGPFVCGEHYAAVDFTLPAVDRALEEMSALRAVVLRYVTVEECRERVLRHAEAVGAPPLAATDDQIVRTALALWQRDDEIARVRAMLEE